MTRSNHVESHTRPFARRGQVIGLLGGSFDPPHAGHVHLTREALKRFDLDQVWWLVSPGNPLKDRAPAPINMRIEAARALVDHPDVRISDFEARAGTRYTAQTLAALKRSQPGVRFVWLMGADNLAQFDHWQDWRWIMDTVPVGVLARPGQRISARMSKAAQIYSKYRLPGRMSRHLGAGPAPRWCFINMPMRDISSTRLRAEGQWPQQDGR